MNYRWLDEKLMSYLIRTQIKDYPVEVPVELLVFLCRIWIVRISERTDSNKDDPHAINLWTKLIAAVGKILETEEWNGGEVLSHEYVLMTLFIFHSLTWETRLMQLKKLFLTLDHASKDPTLFHRLVLARIALMAAYMSRISTRWRPIRSRRSAMCYLLAPSR